MNTKRPFNRPPFEHAAKMVAASLPPAVPPAMPAAVPPAMPAAVPPAMPPVKKESAFKWCDNYQQYRPIGAPLRKNGDENIKAAHL